MQDIETMLFERGNLPIINNLSEISEKAILFRDSVRKLGDFNVAACSNVASNAPMVDELGNILATNVFNWADDERWRSPDFALSSPIPRACRYEGEAFWCNASGFYPRLPNILLDEINLSKFDTYVGVSALMCVPVHMPYGQIGAVSFTVADRDRSDLSEEFEAFGHTLEILSRAFIMSYVKVTDQRNWIPADCSLSKREVQCVSWAALGKTDREIATILSRSCATVRFHLQNAAKKLNAVNRSQTVFKASQLGYLGSVAASKST